MLSAAFDICKALPSTLCSRSDHISSGRPPEGSRRNWCFQTLGAKRKWIACLNKTNSDWNSGKNGGFSILPDVAVNILDPLLLLKVTRFVCSAEGRLAERLSSLALKWAISPYQSCIPVTSSQWVVWQGAKLSEPQFSHGMLRILNEIRHRKQVDLIVLIWQIQLALNHSLCLWIGWALTGQSVLSKGTPIVAHHICLDRKVYFPIENTRMA